MKTPTAMRTLRLLRAIGIIWAAMGLVLHVPLVWAGSPPDVPTPERCPRPSLPSTVDVALDSTGQLQGLIVDIQGVPVAQTPIVIRQLQREVAVTTSDPLGRFAVQGLRGGTYQLIIGQQGVLVRIWTAQAAPPQARPMAVIVVNNQIVRGQMPLENFFASDSFVITGLVAAMIAIPIAAHNSGHSYTSQPLSP